MSKKYLITLTDEDAATVEAVAEMHGRKPTNMVEYFVRVQLGALPEVQPVKVQPLPVTAQESKELDERRAEVERLYSSAPSAIPRKDTKAVTPAEVLTKAEPKGGSVRKGPAQGSIPETAFKEASTQDKMVREGNPIGKALLLKSLSYGEEKPHKVAAPVIPAEVAQEGKPAEGKPAQIPAQGFTINKDVNAYKERVEAGIFTDGKHFFVNKFGTKTFHVSLHSARIAKA